MRTTVKLINIGKSLGTIVPHYIVKEMELKPYDLIEIDIKKIKKEE